MKEHIAENRKTKEEQQIEHAEITEMNKIIARNFEQGVLGQAPDPFGLPTRSRFYKK